MYQAGSQEGYGRGLKAAAKSLLESLNKSVESSEDRETAEVWLATFGPWVKALEDEGKRNMEESQKAVNKIGPTPSKLRQRIINGINGAMDGFKKG